MKSNILKKFLTKKLVREVIPSSPLVEKNAENETESVKNISSFSLQK